MKQNYDAIIRNQNDISEQNFSKLLKPFFYSEQLLKQVYFCIFCNSLDFFCKICKLIIVENAKNIIFF